VDDLARVVDVVDEVVERADPLREPALDRRPLARGDDPRDEVERERAVADRAIPGGAGVERNPLLHEDRVAVAARRRQRLGPERLQPFDERARVRSRLPVGGDQFVIEILVEDRHGPCILVSRKRPAAATAKAWTSSTKR
jgi:hypothetical protein